MNDVTPICKPSNDSEATHRPETAPADQTELIALLNRGYRNPPDAGPMWKPAAEAGVDMSLLEDTLQMSPTERLRAHQRALNQILILMGSRLSHECDSGS